MALYLVTVDKGPILLVRARNGDAALDYAGPHSAAVVRVTEEGEPGIVSDLDHVHAPIADERAECEVDITSLSDPPKTRRFMNTRTGDVRVVSDPNRF